MNDHIAMKGGGYYSLATLGAKHVIDGATPMVLASAIVVSVDFPIPGDPPISTTEPGTIPPMSDLCAIVAQKPSGRPS